ncbi:uncharacterized protein At1g28695-like isoform X2 [Dioscorea cayenensis subsp. rotundata]|uniref:Uncharacterized protein At1g28695-like isoform X2 n=1 Tax=Dioscorea cayennensis subsp. rotundata TaxID=55577 RepID=A0AB40B709_DIOCR|nr:uncharacterized protein At1g28695-like isoform X2 [Dioscorea cayenensis subsp. rotundata]
MKIITRAMHFSVNPTRFAMLMALIVVISVVLYTLLWMPTSSIDFFLLPQQQNTSAFAKDELEVALRGASMDDRTVVISVLNKAYAKENGMLDLFLRSFEHGDDTEFLIKHLLLVAVDQASFERCKSLGLHCYKLVTDGVDFSKEELYMSTDFIKMMWRRTLFLGDVLRHGYNFIFTDMDILWLRSPFPKFGHQGEDMQISCDWFNGRPFDHSNRINTGFYFVVSNSKTIALFDWWYKSRNGAAGVKEQDVLAEMKTRGVFQRLGMKVRFLDTMFFSGFCQKSRDFREVRTVHANCCRTVKAKLVDLTAALQIWKRFNGTATARWPSHDACRNSWKKNIVI